MKVKAADGLAGRHLRVAAVGFDGRRCGGRQGRGLGPKTTVGEIPPPPEQRRGLAVATVQAGGRLELLDALLRDDDLLRSLAVDVAGAGLVPPDDVLAGKLGDPDLFALGAFAQDGHAHFQNPVTGHCDLPDNGLATAFPRRLGREAGDDLAAVANLDGAGGIACGLPSQSRARHREQEKGGGQSREGEAVKGRHDDSSIAPGPAPVKGRGWHRSDRCALPATARRGHSEGRGADVGQTIVRVGLQPVEGIVRRGLLGFGGSRLFLGQIGCGHAFPPSLRSRVGGRLRD